MSRRFPVFLLAVCALAVPLHAAVHIWTGAASELFSDPANWQGGSPAGDPAAELTFPPAATRLTATNDVPSLTVRTISITGRGYRIGGQPIALAAGAQIVSSIDGLTELAADLLLSGAVDVLTVEADGRIDISGSIGGTGPLVKLGPGRALLTGTRPNTYPGRTEVLGGELCLAKSDRIDAIAGDVLIGGTGGSSAYGLLTTVTDEQIPDAAKIVLQSLGTLAVAGTETIGPLQMAGGTEVLTGLRMGDSTFSAGTLILSGDIQLAQSKSGGRISSRFRGDLALARTITITVCNGCGDLEFYSLRETAPALGLNIRAHAPDPYDGSVSILNGSYRGATVIEGGFAEIHNPHTAVRLRGGRFEGNVASLVAERGAVRLARTTGDLRLSPATTIALTLPMAVPALVAGGTLDLNRAKLQWEPDPAIQPIRGTTYTIARSNAPLPERGTFSGVPEGTVLDGRFRVSYRGGDGNDVTITEAGRLYTATDVSAEPQYVTEGESVTLTARVGTDVRQHPLAAGGVTLREGETVLGTVPLDASWKGSITVQPRAGVHEYTAFYEGPAELAPSSGLVRVQVRPRRVVIDSVEPATVQAGTTATLTLRGGSFFPGGNVYIYGVPEIETLYVSPSELRVTFLVPRSEHDIEASLSYRSDDPAAESSSVVIRFRGVPLPPSPFTFHGDAIEGAVIPRGGAVWMTYFPRFANRAYDAAITTDGDGDGTVRLPIGREMPDEGLALTTDLTSRAIASGNRSDRIVEPQPFPEAMFLRDADGEHSQMMVVAEYPRFLQWVRPGTGAWTLLGFDGSPADLDGHTNGHLLFDVSRMVPVGDSPPPPRSVARGDVFLGVGGVTRWFGDVVDDHLDESDGPGRLRFAAASAPVSAEGGIARVTVMRVGGSGGEVSVRYATVDGTAVAGVHYAAVAGTLVFGPGELLKRIEVPLLDDALYFGSTRFKVVLSDPAGAAISGPATQELAIADGESVPRLTLSPDLTVPEGDEGRQEIPVTVTLSGPRAGVPVTVTFSYHERPHGSDTTTRVLSFAPGGPVSQAVMIPYKANDIPEEDRLFSVYLSQPQNAIAEGNRGTVRVADDDFTELTIVDAVVRESTDGVLVAILATVASAKPVRVRYTAVSGSAAEGSDFTAAAGLVEFLPGERRKFVKIAIVPDTTAEGTESFTLTLSEAVNATIRRGTAAIVIEEDQLAAEPAISAAPAVTAEGPQTWATFAFQLSAPAAHDVTFRATTAAGTAAAGDDFVASDAIVHIPAGSIVGHFYVPITNDSIPEERETFSVTVSEATGAAIRTPSVTATILDSDDWRPSPEVGSATVTGTEIPEGDAGTTAARFTVRLAAPATVPVTIAYATADGLATAGEDYFPQSGTLTFARGETTKTIVVQVAGDRLFERDETFTLVLGNGAAAACRVIDDDEAAAKGRAVRH